jgi:hypothetical protein
MEAGASVKNYAEKYEFISKTMKYHYCGIGAQGQGSYFRFSFNH